MALNVPLLMADGAPVHTIEDLWAHFDIDSVLAAFATGELHEWLDVRGFRNEAEAITRLSKALPANALAMEICGVLQIQCSEQPSRTNIRELVECARLRRKLQQYKNGEQYTDRLDEVALDAQGLRAVLQRAEHTAAVLVGSCSGLNPNPDRITEVSLCDYYEMDLPLLIFIANSEVPVAQRELADRYEHGRGVIRDAAAADEWRRRSENASGPDRTRIRLKKEDSNRPKAADRTQSHARPDVALRDIFVAGKLTSFDLGQSHSARMLAAALGGVPPLPADLTDIAERLCNRPRLNYDRKQTAHQLWPEFRRVLVAQLKADKWKKLPKSSPKLRLSEERQKMLNDAFREGMETVFEQVRASVHEFAGALSDILQARKHAAAAVDGTARFATTCPVLLLSQTPDVGHALRKVRLDGALKSTTEKLWPVHQAGRDVWNGKVNKAAKAIFQGKVHEVQIRDLSSARFGKIVDGLEPDFMKILREADVFDAMEQYLDEVSHATAAAMREQIDRFNQANEEALRAAGR